MAQEGATKENTIVLDVGSVEYSVQEAATPIDDIIASLEAAKEDGAEFVTLHSGNHRGAKYMRLREDYEFAGDL